MKKYFILCVISLLFFSLYVGNGQTQWFRPSFTYSPSMLLPVYPMYYSVINYMLGYGPLPLLPPILPNTTRVSKVLSGSSSKAAPAPTTAIPYSSFYFPTTTAVPIIVPTTTYYLYNVNYLTALYTAVPTAPVAPTTVYGTWGLLSSAIAFPFP